ncbi:glycosyl hydrolase family 71-domain-containing protein [Lipomyces orientalis]|uniref:Glycosyl hydrolase family 71-domain-containing protein n=1 Tax=Lipomyces orientalis TaxID=1233043 RepID=A0ACC3TCK1_9ASCO
MKLLAVLALAILLGACQAQAKAVFAHFMVGNAGNYTTSDWENDISLAQQAHIDAFALNIAYNDPTTDNSLLNAFDAANSLGFMLFFSFDYAGNGPWPEADVVGLILNYGTNTAYYQYNGQPFVSTFEGPASASDWTTIKSETGCFFMPDWSSLGAKAALEPGVADGLFSWAAWPWGGTDMDTYTDASYLQFLNGLPYMMPVSPWFFTNLPGYNKNWLWRGDDLWYDRWQQILYVQPEFVEIISWNDYGESHYIGPLHVDAFAAFSIGQGPYNYAANMPHDGWRLFLPFVIDTYKNGIASISQEGLVSWYRLNPATACAVGGTTGNTASQLQIEFEPYGIVQDKVFYSALLASPATVTVSIGGVVQTGTWENTPDGGIGIYHGSVPFNGNTGEVVVTISRSGATIAQVDGDSITTSCTNGITNWNAWVGSTTASNDISATPSLTVSEQVCINGTGANNFEGLCNFTCYYGYCPVGACTCTAMGAKKPLPSAASVQGYPIAGEDASYSGLCSFACNYGYCPSDACGTVSVPLATPTVSDFSPPACIAGTGEGNLIGLCSYTCNYGYCPIRAPCTCTDTGALIPAPPTTNVTGYPLINEDVTSYGGICNFACSTGYCPSTACSTVDLSVTDSCTNPVITNAFTDPETRWNGVNCEDAWTSAVSAVAALPTAEPFAQAMSNYFHGPESFDCGTTADHNGCDNFMECQDTDVPAGYLILNSFITLNNAIMNYYDAIGRIQTSITDDIGAVTSTFTQVASTDTALKVILDIVGLSFALFAAPMWNSLLKGTTYFSKNGNTLGTMKDSVNALVSNGITLVKDDALADKSLASENELSANLAAMVNVWYNSTDQLVCSVRVRQAPS